MNTPLENRKRSKRALRDEKALGFHKMPSSINQRLQKSQKVSKLRPAPGHLTRNYVPAPGLLTRKCIPAPGYLTSTYVPAPGDDQGWN